MRDHPGDPEFVSRSAVMRPRTRRRGSVSSISAGATVRLEPPGKPQIVARYLDALRAHPAQSSNEYRDSDRCRAALALPGRRTCYACTACPAMPGKVPSLRERPCARGNREKRSARFAWEVTRWRSCEARPSCEGAKEAHDLQIERGGEVGSLLHRERTPPRPPCASAVFPDCDFGTAEPRRSLRW